MSETFEKIPKERHLSLCPCKSKKSYQDCCLPFHQNKALPKTAEALMRSRYSAFFFRLVDYLIETTHPDNRSQNLKRELEDTIHHTDWKFLTIVSISKGKKMKVEEKSNSSRTTTGTEKFSNSASTLVSAAIKENGNTTTIKAEPGHFAKLRTSPQSSYLSYASHV